MIYNVIDPSSQFRLHFGYCLSSAMMLGVTLMRCSLIPQSCLEFISFYMHFIATPVYLAIDLAGLFDPTAVPHSEILLKGGCLMLAYCLFYIFYIFVWTYDTWSTTAKRIAYKDLKDMAAVRYLTSALGERKGGALAIGLYSILWFSHLLIGPPCLGYRSIVAAYCVFSGGCAIWNASRFYFEYVPNEYSNYLRLYDK